MDEINEAYIARQTGNKLKQIGLYIRLLRFNLDLSQQDLAFTIQSDKSMISNIERGRCANITLYTLLKISSALNIDVHDLINPPENTGVDSVGRKKKKKRGD